MEPDKEFEIKEEYGDYSESMADQRVMAERVQKKTSALVALKKEIEGLDLRIAEIANELEALIALPIERVDLRDGVDCFGMSQCPQTVRITQGSMVAPWGSCYTTDNP